MLKTISLFLAVTLSTSGVLADTKEEKLQQKMKEVLEQSRYLVSQYSALTDPEVLKRLDYQMERTWGEYSQYYKTNNKLGLDLALLRARAATAAQRKKAVAKNWQTAIRLLPINVSSTRRLGMYAEAANAASSVQDYRSAEQFFNSARLYAGYNEHNADQAQLYLRIQQLKQTGEGVEWRRLNDYLLDMRKESEAFAIWSLPRLDALLAEAEIRLSLQPAEDKEKRLMLSELKAKIELSQKGLDSSIPKMHLERVRTLYYALEDTLGL